MYFNRLGYISSTFTDAKLINMSCFTMVTHPIFHIDSCKVLTLYMTFINNSRVTQRTAITTINIVEYFIGYCVIARSFNYKICS